MLRLIVITLVIAGAWMTWWALGSAAHQKAVTTWIEERREAGWLAEVGEIDVAGFPSRLDTTLTDVELAYPEAGISWQAPFVQLLSLAYKPTEVIAVLPASHRLRTPRETVDITHSSARASVFLDPLPSLPLERSTFVINELNLTASSGWGMDLRELRLAIERRDAPEDIARYRLGAAAYGLVFSGDAAGEETAATSVPNEVNNVQLDATLELAAPLDRQALEAALPPVRRIAIDDLSGRWGDADVTATGALDVGPDGVPTGELSLSGAAWNDILNAAVAMGIVPADTTESLASGLGAIASNIVGLELTRDAELTLTFREGLMWLGPIPVGPAPRFSGY